MVDKFYANLKHKDGTQEIIDAFQAIKLVHTDASIVTKPKSKCPLYDIETDLKVSPVRGRNPFFKYYPDEDSPLKGRVSTLEFTLELKTFIRAFEEIEEFKIEEPGSNPIVIYPASMKKLKRIDTNDSFVILKFLSELIETKPYSYFYKYNGMLGLEFSVTSQPEPIKLKGLEKKGIHLFHSNIEFPAWVSVPAELETELQFEHLAAEIKNTYQNRNYRLKGEFKNTAVTFPEYKEKYEVLSRYEQQCKELEEDIEKLSHEKQQLEIDLKNIRDKSIAEIEKLNSYKQENERFILIEKESLKLKEDVNNITKKLEKSTQDNAKLVEATSYTKKELNDTTEKLQQLKNRNLLSRVLNKNK